VADCIAIGRQWAVTIAGHQGDKGESTCNGPLGLFRSGCMDLVLVVSSASAFCGEDIYE
jgi:hypothetical protein